MAGSKPRGSGKRLPAKFEQMACEAQDKGIRIEQVQEHTISNGKGASYTFRPQPHRDCVAVSFDSPNIGNRFNNRWIELDVEEARELFKWLEKRGFRLPAKPAPKQPSGVQFKPGAQSPVEWEEF